MGVEYFDHGNDYDEDDGDFYDHEGVYNDSIFDENEDSESEDESGSESEEMDVENVNLSNTASNIYIRGDSRKTDNIMTKFEYPRVVSTIAKLYAANFVLHPILEKEVKKRGLIDPLDVATLHVDMLDQIPCPIYIGRPMPDGTIEVWDPKEMILPKNLFNYLI